VRLAIYCFVLIEGRNLSVGGTVFCAERERRNTAVGDTVLCADRWENLVGG